MNSRNFGILVLGIFGIGLAMDGAWAASAAPGREVTLLVVPARPRVVQLAFDMVQLRSVVVVAWHGEAKTAEPVLHVWSGSDWQYVTLPDFTGKKFMAGNARQVIVVGDDPTVPAVLLGNMPWCSNIERLKTIDVADLINSLDRSLEFREREWKWLAGRYGLTLTDLNAARRTMNPYDTPRSKLPLEKREFKQEKGDLAPVQIIEEQPAVAPAAAKPDPEPAEKPPK